MKRNYRLANELEQEKSRLVRPPTPAYNGLGAGKANFNKMIKMNNFTPQLRSCYEPGKLRKAGEWQGEKPDCVLDQESGPGC